MLREAPRKLNIVFEETDSSTPTDEQTEIEKLRKEIWSLQLQLAQEIQTKKIEETILYADNRLVYRSEYNNMAQSPSDIYQSHSKIPEEIIVQKEESIKVGVMDTEYIKSERHKIKKDDIMSMIFLFAIFCLIYFTVLKDMGEIIAKIVITIFGVIVYEIGENIMFGICLFFMVWDIVGAWQAFNTGDTLLGMLDLVAGVLLCIVINGYEEHKKS